jgi:hypothetical protein
MLYIHQLNHFTPKAAEVESVYLIRELKDKTPMPFNAQQMENYLGEFLVSTTERETIKEGLVIIDSIIRDIQQIFLRNNALYEKINLQRAMQILKEMPPALRSNVMYMDGIINWQKNFIPETAALLNTIPKLKSMEDKLKYNEKIKEIFERLLRGKEFVFNYSDIVSEAHVANINGLYEGMAKGFFLHISLEDELKRINYETLKMKLPAETIEELERIKERIGTVKRAVDGAYQTNMRMVNLSLILYAYVKMVSSNN